MSLKGVLDDPDADKGRQRRHHRVTWIERTGEPFGRLLAVAVIPTEEEALRVQLTNEHGNPTWLTCGRAPRAPLQGGLSLTRSRASQGPSREREGEA